METEMFTTYFEAVNTMQQRGYTTMNIENEEKSSPSSRGRHNSKLKVLVRSHAIREEASPPRESSPSRLISPSIKVIPSTETSPARTSPSGNPVVVLSPSLSQVNTPPLSPACASPTSTLVPSPTARGSPQNSPQHERSEGGDDVSSPKYLNRLNRQNLEKDARRETASHNSRKKIICDCSNQNCAKCRSQERNFNNNLTNVNNNVQSSNTLTVNRVNARNKLRQQSSSQGSFEGSSSNSPCLSRDSSSEQYTDTSGADLEVFIPETINRNAKDRAFMLRIEQELVSLAKDKTKTHYKFPPMSSYQRMLVHRCAAYFGMDHNIESSGKCVVVNKTKNTRIPEVSFKEHIKGDVVFSEEPRRSILKRDSNSVEDYGFKSPDRQYSLENRRSKSFEEREEEYAKVRRRIFNREELCLLRQMQDGSNEDFEWAEMPWSSTDSDNSSRFRLQLPEHGRRLGKLTKVLSEEAGETSRPYVAKSYSFGGYAGVLNRGDSVVSTHSAGPRLLTKQGQSLIHPNTQRFLANFVVVEERLLALDSGASSVSWRLSPSSSGYKSQSQMSESITPSPTSTPNQIIESGRQDELAHDKESSDSRIVWAVTDIQRVPKGSIIINPQTGEPIKNEDGSLYHYDPNNPPPGFVSNASKPPPSPKKISPQASPKKRSSKLSPSHKSHLTNSSTSPSLPYSPPLPHVPQQRSFQFVPGMGDGMSMGQQQYPVYGPGYAPPPTHENVQYYQQPCIVYTTPYSVPISPHFEGRMDPQPMNEMSGSYYDGTPAPQTLTYQQPPPSYWNQQPITYFQNAPSSNPTPPQRFPVHPPNQTNYMSSFPQNYLPPPNQAPPPPPSTDLVPVYSQQPVQLVYSTQPSQSNPPVMYPNQPNIVYAQNPIYSSPMYPSQPLPPYPHNTSTPNSCTSSISHTQFSSHVQEQNHQNVMQLTQNMSQLSFMQNQAPNHPNYVMNKMTSPPHFDVRQQKACTPKGGKFGSGPKGFVLGSSQSSTGTNSPAATVVAGYCPQNAGMYRTPPETPPNQYGYGPGFPVPPMLLRQFCLQMSNVRANTPGTARSSRSPTPASEVSHFDRPRIPPPAVYHGMPYVLPTDNRIIPGRNQPNPYRHPPPVQQSFGHQASENKAHKSRKSKGNKLSGVPPNAK
ncbi:cAMP-regulated phosphoprotein 21 isoform X3 [Zophobas morio]|uniref:cAMP-regulated phosphoprotein 21 isoform X3 n=1 Tax=Zophobas morio TaxID=2755281 RepID=UPI003082C4B7